MTQEREQLRIGVTGLEPLKENGGTPAGWDS